MEKQVANYSHSLSEAVEIMETVVEDFELQYNENHIVEKVKVGETDLIAEVNSHADEVGLVNAFKNAIAHGEDPLTKFRRENGTGVPVAIDPNITLDEFNEQIRAQSEQYQKIAASLGISVNELKDAIADGSISNLIKQKTEAAAAAPEDKDGE